MAAGSNVTCDGTDQPQRQGVFSGTLAAPPDDGESCWVLVGYIGERPDTFSVKVAEGGPYGRHFFDPTHRLKWVPCVDVPEFERRGNFRITELRIDYRELRQKREREALAAEIAAEIAATSGEQTKRAPTSPPGRRKGSGLSTLVRHLRDVEKLDYWQILKQLKGEGRPGADKLELHRLPQLYKNGRLPHRDACPFGCKPQQPEK